MLNQAEFLQLQTPNLSHMARTLYIFYLKPAMQKGQNLIDLRTLTASLVSYSPTFPIRPSTDEVGAALDELEAANLVLYVDQEQVITSETPPSLAPNSKLASKLLHSGSGQNAFSGASGGVSTITAPAPQALANTIGSQSNKNEQDGDDKHKDPWRWQGARFMLPFFSQFHQVPAAQATKPFRMYSDWQPSSTIAQAALNAGMLDYSFDEKVRQSFVNYWMTRSVERTQFGWEKLFVQRLLSLNAKTEMRERSIHTPDFKKSSKQQYQTLRSIFTGKREYTSQPQLTGMTRNLVSDGSNTLVAQNQAQAQLTGGIPVRTDFGFTIASGGDPSKVLYKNMQAVGSQPVAGQISSGDHVGGSGGMGMGSGGLGVASGGLTMDDDDLMIIPGYDSPPPVSPFSNGGFITPPSDPRYKDQVRLTPPEILDQLSAYSVQEVADILESLAQDRRFAALFDLPITQESTTKMQGDMRNSIQLTPLSQLRSELIPSTGNESFFGGSLSTSKLRQSTVAQGNQAAPDAQAPDISGGYANSFAPATSADTNMPSGYDSGNLAAVSAASAPHRMMEASLTISQGSMDRPFFNQVSPMGHGAQEAGGSLSSGANAMVSSGGGAGMAAEGSSGDAGLSGAAGYSREAEGSGTPSLAPALARMGQHSQQMAEPIQLQAHKPRKEKYVPIDRDKLKPFL